jgi:hypothetical protein
LQRQPGNRISRAPTKRPGESTGPQFGAWIGEYKGHAPLYLWNLTIKLFMLALLVRIAE